MAFQIVPDVASFKLVGAHFGVVEINNTIYVRNELTGWDTTTGGAMAATIGNAWRDQMCPILSNQYVFDRVEWRDEGAEFGAFGTTEYNTLGGKTSASESAAKCALVSLICQAGGAPRKGHLFISPLAVADFNGNQVNQAARDAIVAAMNAIKTSITGGGNAMVVVSRYSGMQNVDDNGIYRRRPIPRVTGIANDVTAFSSRETFATQRDRRPGEGS